jgi:hypothetical protein
MEGTRPSRRDRWAAEVVAPSALSAAVDHVLNLAYNAILGGQRLEDIELWRNDEAFLDGLGAQRIPDPTTSGDFTRRFDQEAIVGFDCSHQQHSAAHFTRSKVWIVRTCIRSS